MVRAAFCFFDGRLDEAEQLGDQALALGERNGSRLASVEWAHQRISLAIARSAHASIEPHAHRVLSTFEGSPLARSHCAWVLAAIGRREEATKQLREAAAMIQGLPTLIVAAEACALLEDSQAAAAVEEQLIKRAFGTAFFWGSSGGHALGPTSRLLGEIAALLGRRDEARRLFEDSIALCRQVGAEPLLALSLSALARLEEEGSRSNSMESESALSGASPAMAPHVSVSSGRATSLSLTREGDVWAVEGSSGPVFRLKHSKGLSYLNELLDHPGKELHVLALVGLEGRIRNAARRVGG
jgi:tetratricopeptide (TPR) repeat protein